VARFLSPEWIDALDGAALASHSLQAATAHVAFVVEQHVTDGGPHGAPVSWQVVVDHGTVRVQPGSERQADVTFSQDRATALAVARGELSAQAAFMVGRLRVGRDLTAVLEHRELFLHLDDVFASVRAVTDELAAPGDHQPDPAHA
jgi:hypothetical protein